MDDKDFILLQYLNGFDKPIEIQESKAPHDIKVNFEFYGLDKAKHPDSIWVRLFQLSRFKLVKQSSGKYGITDEGRVELEKFNNKKRSSMVSQETLLRYFYKQNKMVTLDDLFEKFGVDDSVLHPVKYLVDNDWIEEVDGNVDEWKITAEGIVEFERRQRIYDPQPSYVVMGHGNIINTGSIEGDIKSSIKILNESGQEKISKAINDLMEAVQKAVEIKAEERQEYLESLKVLSQEAIKPKEQRLPTSTLKQIIKFGLGTLNTFSSISTIAGVNLANISDYFLAQ